MQSTMYMRSMGKGTISRQNVKLSTKRIRRMRFTITSPIVHSVHSLKNEIHNYEVIAFLCTMRKQWCN